MLTIGIDCRFAATPSGLGRYTRELATHLLKRNDKVKYALFVREGDVAWIPTSLSDVSIFVAPFAHYTFAEQTRFPGIIRQAGIDLLFSPHFNVPYACPVPFVVTIHDLILHRYKNRASLLRRLAYHVLFSRAIRHARSIIAVSQFTAAELSEKYGREAKRKTVAIHEGVSSHFAPASPEAIRGVRERHRLPERFFLYVGTAKPHKNVQMLIDAFAEVPGERALVLVTSGKEAESLKLAPRVRLLPSIAEADLPALYSAAECFVTASLYDGFGLPLLEARACGCPAIVSNIGAFREIAPTGTVIVPPEKSAFSEAMRSPPPDRTVPVLPRWEDAAEATAAVLLGEDRRV
jgi:glycosyltransferase involved in cell wall biosynthesis